METLQIAMIVVLSTGLLSVVGGCVKRESITLIK